MVRLVPRPARAHHEIHSRIRPHPLIGGILAGRPSQRGAATHLRHRLGIPGRPGGIPAQNGRSRKTRPPAARPRTRPVLLPRRNRLRVPRIPPKRRHCAPRNGRTLPTPPHRGRLLLRQHPTPDQGRTVRKIRAPGLLRRRHVPTHETRRGSRRRRQRDQTRRGLLHQTHELPHA